MKINKAHAFLGCALEQFKCYNIVKKNPQKTLFVKNKTCAKEESTSRESVMQLFFGLGQV